MLSATLMFQQQPDRELFNLPFLKRRHDTHYQVILDHTDKVIAELTIQGISVIVEYSSDLLLEEYIIIHNILSTLQTQSGAVIDDKKSFLGYLKNGAPAYIMTNWEHWINHLDNSMKNCL